MNGWILVTGGVASGIGKGVAAAMIGRRLARRHGLVDYRKLEPCLQASLAHLPNTAIGEIVHTADGHHHDADVARAAFWIPGFTPDQHSDLSLGHIAALLPTNDAAPRLVVRIADTLRTLLPPAPLRVVEVGGTAGEPEHGILLRALIHALGRPLLHVHVTMQTLLQGGRATTKPAQLSLDALPCPPDHVFVRGDGPLDALRAHLGALPVTSVPEDVWAERAWHRALAELPMLGVSCDPVLEVPPDAPIPIDVVTDVGLDAYESLRSRLFAWTRGRARIVRGGAPLRIGEASPALVAGALCIVPVESGHAPRDPSHRPDWHGTADAPSGALADWLARLPASMPSDAPSGAPPVVPYALPGFAATYLSHSHDGRLRDHGVLAGLLDRALPVPLAGRRILDVGCGDGRLAARFTAAGAQVVGVEPSPPMADAAEARSLPGFQLLRAAAETFRVDGTFDVAVAWMSLDHAPSLTAALANIARTLRPGGRLVACTEHALRTAPRDGIRWGPDAARVRDYATPGWRTFHWFGRPEPVPVYHLPLGAWVDAARAAGLTLVHLAEPAEDADHGVPRFQLFVFERLDRTDRTITLDGPAGCGKSTLGHALARRLGTGHPDAVHLDTGRLVRTLGLRSLRGGTLGSVARDCDIVWLLDGAEPGAALDTPQVLARCAEVSDEAVLAELARFDRVPRIVSGRAWGRTLSAGTRLWLETPAELRAQRRGVAAAGLLDRDERDRVRGRLLPPDVAAVVLDGRRDVQTLVEDVMDTIAW
jgi:SAM-dependent methyltransferase/cytidylate kinase